MKELINSLTSPYWWISVVVFGILINLFSAYIKPWLDKRFSSISVWWRERSQQQKMKREAIIQQLCSSQEERLLTSIDDIRKRSRATHFLLMGVFIMGFNGYVFLSEFISIFILAFSAICFFMSYLSFVDAAKLKGMLNEAQKRINDQQHI